jgi:hypothetical protein
MIFLTGDVHHTDPRMGDQALAQGWSEAQLCEPYLRYANEHSIYPTLFFTGLVVEREGEFIASLKRRYQFEIGGHTYSANRHRHVLALSRRLLGLANGPYWLQKRDMVATIGCIRNRLGVTVVSWRNHAYRMDRNTYAIAAGLGIRQVSNVVTGFEGNIRKMGGILEVPINTLPDHESLGHDDHWRQCATPGDWVDKILEQIEYQQNRGLPSIILAHPLCMFVEDRMLAFKRLCNAISSCGWRTATMSDCPRMIEQNQDSPCASELI